MTKTLIILGTSGLAHEVLLIATRVNEIDHRWDEFGFVCPIPTPHRRERGIWERTMSFSQAMPRVTS